MPLRFIRINALLLAVFWAGLVQAETLQCKYIPQLFEIYLRHHYEYHALSDLLKQRTVEQYLKRLDPQKSLLLESDVGKLKRELIDTFQTSSSGDCHELDDGNKLLLQRAKENEKFAKEFLGPKYKLDESVEIVVDPQKRPFAKTQQEKKGILRKLVHFQIANYLAADMKLPEAKKQLIHRYELVVKRLGAEKEPEILSGWAESFALSLDPHSSYLSQDDMQDFQIQMQLSLEGIGASLTTQDGFTVIDSLIPGGGAEKSKQLHPQDKIIAVAQEDERASERVKKISRDKREMKVRFLKPVSVIDMDLRDVVKLIRGKKGTEVKLTILRQKPKNETFDVSIMRDKIDIKEQAAKVTYQTRKIGSKTLKLGILDLPSFYGGGGRDTRWSSTDVQNLLADAKKEKVDGIVLNLSKNGGGLLEEAVKISGLFIHKGGVVATKDSQDQKVQVLNDEDEETNFSGPLVILTSRFSASASEILTGALKDYKRALVVGADHTFGKGTVQAVSPLPGDLGGMKVTTGMFFLPGGESTQHAGVASDIQLPSVFNSDDVGESKLDYSLPPQAITAFLSDEANSSQPDQHWVSIDNGTIKKLAEKSRVRVAKDSKFDEIRKDLEDSRKNKGVVRLAELVKKLEKENHDLKKRKKKGDHDDKNNDVDEPVVQESVNILADLIESKS